MEKEIKIIPPKEYDDKDDSTFIKYDWPDYQPLMELEGYKENIVVPMPIDKTNDEFNSCVLIRKSWLEGINNQ